MSHTFTDEDLQTWEAFASSGDWGRAVKPRIMFNCLSDPGRRARYVERPGDEADAEEQVIELDEQELRDLLKQSQPLE